MDGDDGSEGGRARWRDFAAARWGPLETVALAATLDADAARRLTTDALRDVRRRWARVVEEGAPTAAARAALLEQVARFRPERDGVDPLLAQAAADDDSAVPAALLSALARESPLVRATTGAAVHWDIGGDEVVRLLPRAAATALAGSGPVRDRLLEAHREARAADGLGPRDDLLDEDLADLLRRMAEAVGEPPDPDGLVDPGPRPGRRLAVSGVAGAAVAGVAGWVVLGRDRGRPVVASSGPTTSAAPTALPAPDSPLWRSASTWPARGSLAGDRRIALLVASAGPGSRLLFAEDLHGVRLVAATDPSQGFSSEGTAVRWWRGPAGTVPEQLAVTSVGYEMLEAQKVAYGGLLPSGNSLVLVLGRPTARDAEVSLRVTPTVEGTVERAWEPVRVSGGIGEAVVDRALGPAARLRFDGYDGGLPVVLQDAAADGFDLTGMVSSATGVLRDRLDTDIDVRPLPPSVRVAGTQRVYAVRTVVRLPSRAVVRTVELVDSSRSFSISTDGARVVPAADVDGPTIVTFYDDETGREQVLVVLDPEATRLRALPAASSSVPAQSVPVRDGIAVLDLGDGGPEGVGDVVLRATTANGRTVHDGPVRRGVSFLDLVPTVPGSAASAS